MNTYKSEHNERTLSKKSENSVFINKDNSKTATNNNEDNCIIDINNKEYTNQNHSKIDNNNDCKTNSYTGDCFIVNEEINVCKEINFIVVKKKIEDLYDKKEINGRQLIRETKQTISINGINMMQVLCRKPLYQYIDL